MALPRAVEDVLAHRSWYDPAQDRSWRRCDGASQDVRGCATAIRPQEEDGGAAGTEGVEAEAGQEVLHGGQVGT